MLLTLVNCLRYILFSCRGLATATPRAPCSELRNGQDTGVKAPVMTSHHPLPGPRSLVLDPRCDLPSRLGLDHGRRLVFGGPPVGAVVAVVREGVVSRSGGGW
jgi:hypothetical protein